MITTAAVRLWGTTIGAVTIQDEERYARFEYDHDFLKSRIELSPINMPLSERVYSFPALSTDSFYGLPGLLADSLPDSYGQALINAWLASRGRAADSMNCVERLCYTGTRGMGALEFIPAMEGVSSYEDTIHMESLVELASAVMRNRDHLAGYFRPDNEAVDQKALSQIQQIGTSAGGARAKAVIAWNKKTQEVRSGQIDAGKGFDYYLMKFDGIGENRDKEDRDGNDYTRIEYAYYLMAQKAGIIMNDCFLWNENGRHHFLTKRFDRTEEGRKIHMQTLSGMGHFDFRMDGAYSYEQAFQILNRIAGNKQDAIQLYTRMLFNVLAVNHDDHIKNISFLMDRSGKWSLSPAYDVTYAFNPAGRWTRMHQMSINGKRENFVRKDFWTCAQNAGLKKNEAEAALENVMAALKAWPACAEKAGLTQKRMKEIQDNMQIAKTWS